MDKTTISDKTSETRLPSYLFNVDCNIESRGREILVTLKQVTFFLELFYDNIVNIPIFVTNCHSYL